MRRTLFTILFAGLCGVLLAQEKGIAQFQNTKHDFGEIEESDGPVNHRFEFTNTGSMPLLIKGVKASCGCTTPAWSKEPVMPGETGFIEAQYNPRNRPGAFRKSLTVTSDGDVPTVYLYITGKVNPRPRTIEDDFKIKMGPLRLKTKSVNMGRITTEKPVEKLVEVYNDSDQEITFKEETQSVDFIKITFMTPKVASKGRGQIKVGYNPDHKDNLGRNNHKIWFGINESETMMDLNVIATITEYFAPLTEEEKKLAPKLNIQDRIFDFGKMPQGAKKQTEFILTNNGLTKLNIRDVKSNCACAAAVLENYDIEPGKSTLLRVQFDSKNRRGNQIKTITIFSNDPQDPTQLVSIKANVVVE